MSASLNEHAARCSSAILLAALLLGGCQAPNAPTAHKMQANKVTPVYRDGTLRTAPLRPERRQLLARHGVEVLTRLGQGRFLLRGTVDGFAAVAHAFSSLHATDGEAKLSRRLRSALVEAKGSFRGEVWAFLAPGARDEELARLDGLTSGRRRVGFAPLYALGVASTAALQELAEVGVVRHLDLPPAPAKALLDQARQQIAVEPLHALSLAGESPSYGLAGAGMVAGIWDPHGVEPTHGDLASRLLRYPDPKDAPSLSHGTAVGSCLAGSGERSAQAPMPYRPFALRGVAPEAKLAMYLTGNDHDAAGKPTAFVDQFTEARQTYGIDVASFSFSHQSHALYDSVAANLDYLIAGQAKGLGAPIPIAVAAANDGYRLGYGSVSSLASAKNTLTVGASSWPTSQLWGASSFGPTEDGRVKPEIVAPGCSVHGGALLRLSRLRILSSSRRVPAKVFDFTAGTLGGWAVQGHLETPTLDGGALVARSSGSMPRLLSPGGLAVEASDYDTVEVTMSLERHHKARIWWLNDGETQYGWARQRSFLVSGDGAFQTYRINVGADKDWKGVIQRLRLSVDTAGIALAKPGNTYGPSCGTSMATPIAAGAVLLLVQKHRQLSRSGERPSPALLKALLIASARDLSGQTGANPDLGGEPTPYGKGPDNASGFGEIDVARAVELLEAVAKGPSPIAQGRLQRGGQKVQLRLRPKASAVGETLQVTLVWDDPAGEPGQTTVLQNDLDLRILTPGGAGLQPLVPSASTPQTLATPRTDRRNNVEQVHVEALEEGDTILEISGHELTYPGQPFVVVVSAPELLAAPLAMDGDGDGSFTPEDCDDADPAVHPGATEVPYNRKDDDCSATTPDVTQPPAPDAGAAKDASSEVDAGTKTGSSGCSVAAEASPLALAWLLLALALLGRKKPRVEARDDQRC